MKRTALRSDPSKTRQWLDKHRGKGLKRTGMPRPPRSPSPGRSGVGGRNGPDPAPRRETGLQRARPKPRWSPPAHVRAVVLARSQGVCVACAARAGFDPDEITPAEAYVALHNRSVRKARDCHHVLDRQTFPDLIREPDNLVGVCRECHANHESAFERIPAQAIPTCAARLAAQTSPAAWRYLVTRYPRLPGSEPSGRVLGVPDQE